jgi:hypothetical protein
LYVQFRAQQQQVDRQLLAESHPIVTPQGRSENAESHTKLIALRLSKQPLNCASDSTARTLIKETFLTIGLLHDSI